MSKWFTPDMNDGNTIFVFGSNLAGRHGAGAALEAKRHWGAVQGIGEGRTGQAYAIATKNRDLRAVDVLCLVVSVKHFLLYAWNHPELRFLVTEVGCGLAGRSPDVMATMFLGHSPNCILSPRFKRTLAEIGPIL